MHSYLGRAPRIYAAAIVAALAITIAAPDKALAVPSFARKYETTCTTCHTVYPVLNAFGEAFRRNGYRMPSKDGSLDSDLIKAEVIELGQEEYKDSFPNSVWPDKIMKNAPFSVMLNGGVHVNLPGGDSKKDEGNTFTWNGVAEEFHLFGAGAFNDNLTYFTEVTVSTTEGVSLESAYLLWNDVVGPSHLVNIWLGRLMSPQITSFGNHSSYMADNLTPAVSIGQLFNPDGSFVLGHNDSDGVEVNGIVNHRLGYSLGWLASGSAASQYANAQDGYAHVGYKFGGMSLDGEDSAGSSVADVKRPWEETALTLDGFAYHGLSRNANAASSKGYQDDKINAAGASFRLQLKSFTANAGIQFEAHSRPFGATAATATAMMGTLDRSKANGFTQYDELSYIVYPWLVPAVRMELTQLNHKGDASTNLMRILPGVAMLARPNVKVILQGVFETAKNTPAGGWGDGAGASVAPGAKRVFKAQQIAATVALAF